MLGAVGRAVGFPWRHSVISAFEIGGHIRPQRLESNRCLPGDRPRHPEWSRAAERPLPREHFVEHRAEGEDVRPSVNRKPLRLLGRHVRWRPQHGAGMSDTG